MSERSAKPQAARLFEQYRDSGVVYKAKQYATFTLPSLMVDPLQSTRQTVEHDFQSVGALLTNNLASKLVGALFPTGYPFFKSTPDKALREAAAAEGLAMTDLSAKLAVLDREATERLFLNASLSKLTRAIKLLIVTGNVLLYRDTEAAELMVWSVQSFVVKRQATGKFRTVILKQRFKFDELPIEIRNDLTAKGKQYKPNADIDLYTTIDKQPGVLNPRVIVWNEVDGVRCGPESSYPEHLCPYIVATWNLADGEDYGRGLVEDFTGDFAKVSLVSEQLGLYELEALSMLNLVDEAAGGVVDDYIEADTGAFVRGKVDGVKSYERGDYKKIAVVRESIGEVVQRLSMAFMYTGSTRQAERVTAEEIRATAREAEHTLGGVYSLLAETLSTLR